jgi:hypothetical protein
MGSDHHLGMIDQSQEMTESKKSENDARDA